LYQQQNPESVKVSEVGNFSYESKKHNYESEKYNILTMANDIAFDRKLEYETSFDGVVKISRLKTANQNLNSQLNRKNYRGFSISLKMEFFFECLIAQHLCQDQTNLS
jgi:hypothetical protein